MLRLLFTICVFLIPNPLTAQDLVLHPSLRPLPFPHLGPFVRTTDGNVLAIESEATRISRDDGLTWSEPRPIGISDLKISNERTLLCSQDGSVVAAFMNLNERNWTWKNELHDAPGAKLPTWVMRSTDHGQTWQHAQKLHDDWTGCVRDIIQTGDGRIIFTSMKMLHDPGRHAVLTYCSEDDGITWRPSNLIDLGGRGHHGGVTEPTLTELRDGRVWMLIRTNRMQFWSGYSDNGGRHWQILQPSGIPASSAPGMLTRLHSGRLMLLWNRPFPEGQSSWPLSGGDGLWSETAVSNFREELSVAFSDNDGGTWTKPLVIAAHAGKWISYPYVFEVAPGRIWLTTMQGDVRAEFRETEVLAAAGDAAE
ncbi:MAG: exo-alpha-sialidase [Planctomycetaceae bacterium]|nr:exo-alpha-sialidase [Planctomycetaceae bacterium]